MPYDGHHDQTHMQAQKYIGSHVFLAFCVAKNIAMDMKECSDWKERSVSTLWRARCKAFQILGTEKDNE